MKILMFAPGSWIHSRRSLQWLFDSGHTVVFVSRTHPEIQDSDKFKFIYYPGARGKKYYSWLGKSLSSYIADWTIKTQLKIIKNRIKADITHLHWLDNRAYQVIFADMYPLIISVLGSDVNKFFKSEYNEEDRRKAGKVLQKADLVLVDSKDMIGKCQTLAHGKANVKYFPIGIETKRYAMDYENDVILWKKKLNVEKNALILTSVRALNPIYNQHLIIQAFIDALPQFKEKTYLLLKNFNNHDKKYKEEIINKINKLSNSTCILWIDEFIPDEKMPVFYAASDLIINFPSYDAFPISLIEAAAAGKPVITCDLPAYRGTFAEKYFYFIEKENVVELKNALIKFVNHQFNSDWDFREEARKFVQDNYDQENSIRDLNNIYQNLVQNNN